MKRALFLVILASILVVLLLFGLNGTVISIADTSIPDNEVVGSIGEANNSSASATITITATTAPLANE